MWVVLDSLTRTIVRMKSAVVRGSAKHNTGTPGRQSDIQEDKPFFEDGVRIQFLGAAATTLWRCIEINVVSEASKRFVPPIMDLGCGDGAFYHLCVGTGYIGMDMIDNLQEVVRPGIYDKVLKSDITKGTELPSGSIGTVFANSVMEHVTDLDAALLEISRLLKPGGLFAATVPLRQFYDGLANHFGESQSRRINNMLAHANLLTVEEWAERLSKAGLTLEEAPRYMSPRAGQMYSVLVGSFVRNIETRTGRMVWDRTRNKIKDLVKSSLSCQDGYCALLLARKT